MSSRNIVILTSANPFLTSGKTVLDIKESLSRTNNVTIISRRYFKSQKNILSLESKLIFYKDKFIRKLNSIFFKKFKVFFDKQKADVNYYMFSYKNHLEKKFINKVLKKIPNNTDIIVYIFCVDFLNDEEIFIINEKKNIPIIRIMIDMAEITGGCHFAWDCEGYLKNCGNCPGLFSKDPNDLTYQNLFLKKKYINKTNLNIVAASNQQFRQLKQSSAYANVNKFKVLLPTTESIFYNQNKVKSKVFFNLPLDKKIILFGAVTTSEKRKGGEELIEALAYLKANYPKKIIDNLHLIIAGNSLISASGLDGFNYTTLGYLSYEQLAKAYNAADFYLCTSIQDSGPSMINQSLSCGTPVISFDIGVSRDLILNNKTGLIVEYKNTKKFAEAISNMVKKSRIELKEMENNCLLIAKKKCSYQSFYNDFSKIINSIIDDNK